MKISFLITFFNQEDYVRKSLDSIISIDKEGLDWEILVGDDNSSDNTLCIVNEYVKKYPEKIFCYTPKHGDNNEQTVRKSSENRINLIKNMTGDFFCFLDGDDNYCNCDFVKKALNVFDKYNDLSVVAFGYRTFSEEEGIIKEYSFKTGRLSTEQYIKYNYTPAGACVFKNCFNKFRINVLENVGYYDDNDIILFNLNYGSLYVNDKIVYSYRQVSNSTYNSMGQIEKAVLNSQSYDVNKEYIDKFKLELADRYMEAILLSYFYKVKIKQCLGKDKWSQYRSGCKSIPNSITYIILNWENSNYNEKKYVKKEIHRLIKKNFYRALKLIIKKMMRKDIL